MSGCWWRRRRDEREVLVLGRSDGFFMLGNRLIHHSKSPKLVHTNGEGTAGRRVEREGGGGGGE